MDEAEAVGVHVGLQGGLVHQDTNAVVGQQQRVQLLDHPHGVQAAQGAGAQALMGVDLVHHQFDLPALMVGADQLQGRCQGGVEQGGDQAVDLPIADQGRIGDGVRDDAHQQAVARLAPPVLRGPQVGQIGAVRQGAHPLRTHMGGQAGQHVGSPSLHISKQVILMKAAVPQDQHARCHRAQHPPPAHPLASVARPEPRIDDGMGATLGQVDAFDLGEGTRPPPAVVAPERGGVGRRVGHVLRGPVDGHQAQAIQEGPFRLRGGQRAAHPVEQGHQRPGPQLIASVGERTRRGRRHLRIRPDEAQPAADLAQHITQRDVGVQVHGNQGEDHHHHSHLALPLLHRPFLLQHGLNRRTRHALTDRLQGHRAAQLAPLRDLPYSVPHEMALPGSSWSFALPSVPHGPPRCLFVRYCS